VPGRRSGSQNMALAAYYGGWCRWAWVESLGWIGQWVLDGSV